MRKLSNGFDVKEVPWNLYVSQKKNQVFKLLPLREENGDWKNQLDMISKDLGGLEYVSVEKDFILVQIIVKLGILYEEEDFLVYRKVVFEILTLLGEW